MSTYTHQLEQVEGEYHCMVCLWRWKSRPTSICPGVPRLYGEYFLTYTQLQKKHLKPADREKPDACYYRNSTREYVWLYDERKALPRRIETEAQKAAHAKAWATTQEKYRCPKCKQAPECLAEMKQYRAGGLLCNKCAEWEAYEAEQDRIDAMTCADFVEQSEWAAALLQRDDWVILDTETTDLIGYLCEIAIVAPDGRILFQSLINPQWKVDHIARLVHKISDEELLAAPTLPQIWPQLLAALDGRKTIVTFNVDFDKSTIDRDAARYNLTRPKFQWQCLMLKYAAWCGNYSEYRHDYIWQSLPGGDHRAAGDALAALELIHIMASQVDRARREAEQAAQKKAIA